MATTTPDPNSIPARDPGILRSVIDGDDVDQWEVYRKRADAADPSPRMVTGYCRLCAAGVNILSDGYHLVPKHYNGFDGYEAVPCTGEYAPRLQARPTQYCFWCSIGSPTDERGQHHVDGDIHQCTGQQVPQAQPAEAGDEVAREGLVLASPQDEIENLRGRLEKTQDLFEELLKERDDARAELNLIARLIRGVGIELADGDSIAYSVSVLTSLLAEAEKGRHRNFDELAQARREAEAAREGLEKIANCDRDDWIEHESMIDHIYHIAREALEAK